MKKCRVFVPFGAIGMGINDEAFCRGVELKPDVISADAGSTDSGPYYLGTGSCKYAREAVKRDVKMMVCAGAALKIPVTIGSSGTCGVDQSVDEMADIIHEIAVEEGLVLKIAKIYSEQSPENIAALYNRGKLEAMSGAPLLSYDDIMECEHIVGLAGIEPFIAAFKQGADVIICGRATDTAVIAAYPIYQGCNEAMSWHAAKTMECGCICTTDPFDGGVFAELDETGFTVEATSPTSACTPYTISAHLLYENADPIKLWEPGICINTSQAVYTQIENGKVRVEGTTIEKLPYTIKLEGARAVGYQTASLTGIRDRTIMKDPYHWLNRLEEFGKGKLDALGISREEYAISMAPYGYNAVYGGEVPDGYVPNEIGVLFRCIAKTQEMATKIAKIFNPYLLHYPVEEGKQMPSFAFPFSPNEFERGRQYEFVLYHLAHVDDYNEMFRIEYEF